MAKRYKLCEMCCIGCQSPRECKCGVRLKLFLILAAIWALNSQAFSCFLFFFVYTLMALSGSCDGLTYVCILVNIFGFGTLPLAPFSAVTESVRAPLFSLFNCPCVCWLNVSENFVLFNRRICCSTVWHIRKERKSFKEAFLIDKWQSFLWATLLWAF